MDSPSPVVATPGPESGALKAASQRSMLSTLAPIAYLLVLMGTALTAYWKMFSQFAPYDDSGFFINSIRLFSQGHVLYDRVWTDYGPFSYEVWGTVFGVIGNAVSTDSARLATIVVWLLTSLLLGVSCQRLTGRLVIGVAVQILSFTLLSALTAEPMHASGVACALLAIAVATVSFVLPGRPRAARRPARTGADRRGEERIGDRPARAAALHRPCPPRSLSLLGARLNGGLKSTAGRRARIRPSAAVFSISL